MPNIPVGAAATGPNTNPADPASHQLVRGLASYGGSSGGSNPVPVGELLQGGVTGVAYEETISAQGGTSPCTYAVSAGALPSGLSLTGSTGVIAGTPSATGTFGFTITVTDASSNTGSQPFAIVIASASASGGGSYAFIA